MQVLAHAFAKAAMFLSAGVLAEALGHDQIARLGGAARVLPMTFLTIALGGLSLMGLPPSGGFSAKWLMLRPPSPRANGSGRCLCSRRPAGGRLHVSHSGAGPVRRRYLDGIGAEARPGGDRACVVNDALALGFAPQPFFDFLEIGRPMSGAGLP